MEMADYILLCDTFFFKQKLCKKYMFIERLILLSIWLQA